jgi:hypothetical protein
MAADRLGIFTSVRAFLLKHILRFLAPDAEITVRMNFPREWIVCHFCGESGWGIHPHYGVPCPIAAGMAESAGMKMDAERTTTIRMGTQMEEATRMMRKHFGEEDDDE